MKSRALLGVVIAFGGFAGPATAASVKDGYGGRADVLGEVGEVQAPAGSAAPAPDATPPAGGTLPATVAQQQPQAVAGDTLPFTGADVVLLLVGGLTLLGAGVVLRRMAFRGA